MQIYEKLGHVAPHPHFCSECGSNWSTNVLTFFRIAQRLYFTFSGRPTQETGPVQWFRMCQLIDNTKCRLLSSRSYYIRMGKPSMIAVKEPLNTSYWNMKIMKSKHCHLMLVHVKTKSVPVTSSAPS